MTEALLCSQCGAPLEVPSGVTYCQCRHCNTALMIHREPSVVYTEVINRLDRDVSQMAWHVAELRYEKEVARLEEEWEAYQRRMQVRDKHGTLREPHRYEPYMMIVVGIVFIVVFGVLLVRSPPVQIGVVMATALFVGWFIHRSREHYVTYWRAERWYKNKIRSLKVEDFLP